jgi:hypothetical protein
MLCVWAKAERNDVVVVSRCFFRRPVLYGTKNSHCLIQKSNTLSISWDNSVGMANAYGLDEWGSISGRSKGFSLPHIVTTGSGAHQASYPVGTGDSMLGSKAL